MKTCLFILFFAHGAWAQAKESLTLEIRMGHQWSRYTIRHSESTRTIEFENPEGGKLQSLVNKKDYEFILSEFKKLSSPQVLPDACHRQSVEITYSSRKQISKKSCLNLRTITEPQYRRFINLVHLAL